MRGKHDAQIERVGEMSNDELIRKHDPYYMYSDDHDVYRLGAAISDEIRKRGLVNETGNL